MNAPIEIIRDTLRQWRRHPVPYALAGASLALAIAGTAALVALVDAIHFRTLAVRSPDTLIQITATRPGLTAPIVAFPTAFWDELRASGPMHEIAAAGSDQLTLSVDGDARLADALFVSSNFLDLLGVAPVLGRTLGGEDDRTVASPRGLISHALWQTAFAGRPDAIGQTLFVQRTAVDIVGVLPESFIGIEVGRRADIVLPLAAERVIKGADSRFASDRTWWLQLFGRLRPGQTRNAAGEALRVWFDAANPPALRTSSFDPSALRLEAAPGGTGASALRDRFGHALWILLAGAFLVVCLASVNAASIFLARFADREREFSIRQALGATRAHLVIRRLLEALALTGTAAAAGVALAPSLAAMAIPWFATAGPRLAAPHVPIDLNWKVAAAGAALALLSGAIAGMLPAMRTVHRMTGTSGRW
jgi:hypothetical protein